MVKDSVYKSLIIVVVVCVSLVFVVGALTNGFENLVVSGGVFSEADFLLEVDLSGSVFSVGESLTGNATVTNISGKNVRVVSNGYMPCTYLHSASDTNNSHPERESLCIEILRANDNLSGSFVYEFTEPGMYVLYVHYYIEVNGVWLSRALEGSVIEVK
jgi:hypothetical protein